MHRTTATAILAACAGAAYAQCTPAWQAPDVLTYPEGVNGNVLCSVVWDPDGPGNLTPVLVVGGSFDTAHGAGFNHIAMYDGSGWKPLHVGVNGDVTSLTVDTFNGLLIAGGNFTTAGLVSASKIARFSPATLQWSAVGPGITSAGTVQALAFDPVRHDIYAGGDFTSAGGVSTGGVARIHISNVVTYMDTGGFFLGTARALAYEPSTTNIYCGGTFPGTQGSPNIARFNTTSLAWSGMGSGIPGSGVWSLDAYNDGTTNQVVAGGSFGIIGGTTFNSVARWNGSAWQPMASGLVGTVQGLANVGKQLYAVGTFVLSGTGSVMSRAAHWTGSFWEPLGTGLDNWGYAATAFNNALYVGGSFASEGNTDGTVTSPHIARWEGRRWQALGSAPSGPVKALWSTGTGLIIGGQFDMYDGTNFAHNIVSYSGSGSGAFASYTNGNGFNGTNGPVNAILVKDNGITLPTVVVGGNFSLVAGGTVAYSIASWTNFDWGPVGSGVQVEVAALAQYGCTGPFGTCGTVATGPFFTSGGTTVNHIARWGPGSVSVNLGTGLNQTGRALLNYNGKLVVGGDFTTAGGLSALRIAQWDGTGWSSFNGASVDGPIRAMANLNGDLVVAGDFGLINGQPMNRVARWNGSSWVNMGAGLEGATGHVSALTVHNGELYAGGDFGLPGASPAIKYIARWNGSAWVSLGADMNGEVLALASSNGRLWAGGSFTHAGTTYSPFLSSFTLQCACYANCDGSSAAPILNANDFSCFLNSFAAGAAYANCDHSSVPPLLNANDFSCFLNSFAAGCP